MTNCLLKTNINIILLMSILSLADMPIIRGKQIYIETVKLYPQLNFEVIRSSPLWIWDEHKEFRYWEQFINWNLKPLRVIIVPFSHNDAAWLQTFEEYYETKTKRILDNIINILPEIEDMTFVWSEVCFLQYWWDRSTERNRNTFKHLVNVGKVEILAGGWVMPDEATTHVFSLYNQLVEGHQWIWENLGIRPENSWSIDPFGCSSVMAYLLAISGINGLVIQRIHYSWKRFFSDEGILDWIWEQDFQAPNIKLRIQQNSGYTVTDSCGPATSLCPEYDFNKETSDADHLTFGNIHKKAEVILGLYGRIGSLSESNVALITLGGDFRFVNESEWFQQYRNYKALMDYVNNVKSYKAEIHFGTLKTFFNEIQNCNATLQGDFFPYADLNSDNSLAYWTGFYTTRPYWKKLVRILDSSLRSTEILYTLTFNAMRNATHKSMQVKKLEKHFKKLIRARRTSALFQHHDGITGTSKARVMDDYKNKMLRSIHEIKIIQKSCMEMMLQKHKNTTCIVEKLVKKILVFNNLPYHRPEVIMIKTDYPGLIVMGPQKNQIHSQVNCVFKSNVSNSQGNESYELTFIDLLPPFSIKAYEIHTMDVSDKENNYISWDSNNGKVDGLSVANSKQIIVFGEHGLIKNITKTFGSIAITSSLKGYIPEEGNSGAYLFRPLRHQINLFSEVPKEDVFFLNGSIYKEARVFYEKGYSISTRLYGSNSDLDEIIEMKITHDISETDTELFIEFVTGLKGTMFYTDVNSFEMRERIRNTFQFAEGNYYPITSVAYIENGEFLFAIITDHSHGAASLEDGSIEIMLDRRISVDDKRGLDEPLEDRLKTTSTLYIVFLNALPKSKEILHKLAIQLNNHTPIVVTSFETPSVILNLINYPLPFHINILNFRTLSRSGTPIPTALMTLHNLGTDNVNVNTFFNDTKFTYINIKSIFKTSLTGLKDEYEIDELYDAKVKAFNILSLKLLF